MPIDGHEYSIGNDWHSLFRLFYPIKLIFSWISHLLDKSHKQKTLDLIDLYDLLPQYESIKLTETLEDNWLDDIKRYPDKPSLFRATIQTIRWKPLLIGCSLVLKVSIYLISSFNIILFDKIFQENSTYYSAIVSYIFNGFLWTMFHYVYFICMFFG